MAGMLTNQIVEKILRKHPHAVPPAQDFDLNDPESNQALLQTLTSDARCAVVDHHIKSPVFRLEQTIFLQRDDLIAYMVIWEECHCAQLQRDIVDQVFLWRKSGLIAALGGLPAKVFWGLLLPRHGCLAADLVQVAAGTNFWIERIREAFRRRLHVCFMDFETGRKEALTDLQNLADALAPTSGWNKKTWHVVITSSPLDSTEPASTAQIGKESPAASSD